ncbi:MlaD family protein [Sphingomonas oryzagri]
MERHAHFALVGIISTLLLIAALIFVVWLGRAEFHQRYDRYRIVFQGPVRGLSEGGDVQFNGIKFGQIQHITLDPKDPDKVITDIQLESGTPVRVDSEATTEAQGISGVNIIQISAGNVRLPLLSAVDHRERPVIRSKPNALSALLQGGGQMVQSATEALGRVNRLLSDQTIANVSGALQDIHATTTELAANKAMFDRAASALDKLDKAATDIQAASSQVRQITGGDGRRAFADISSAASELKLTVRDARATIAKLDGQVGTVGSTTLPALNSTLETLQQTGDTLDGLIRDIRQDPRGTLTKPRGKELELPR